MTPDELYLKLTITYIVNQQINKHRSNLQKELIDFASDPILLKRRYRMIGQLAEYESQIYKKIYQFSSNDIDDYALAAQQITNEITCISNRNG